MYRPVLSSQASPVALQWVWILNSHSRPSKQFQANYLIQIVPMQLQQIVRSMPPMEYQMLLEVPGWIRELEQQLMISDLQLLDLFYW